MKKHTKKLLAFALAMTMLLGTMLTTEAAARDVVSRSCPACGQSNLYSSSTSLDCRMYVCNKPVYKFNCGKCGVLYYVCTSGHYR